MQTDPVLLDRAKAMRRNMTEPERRLWHAIKAERLGTKFSRQIVIDRTIADFVARRVKLIIEVDGDTHDDPAKDAIRDKKLINKGYRVIHLTNADVMTNLKGVLEVIRLAIDASLSAATKPCGQVSLQRRRNWTSMPPALMRTARGGVRPIPTALPKGERG